MSGGLVASPGLVPDTKPFQLTRRDTNATKTMWILILATMTGFTAGHYLASTPELEAKYNDLDKVLAEQEEMFEARLDQLVLELEADEDAVTYNLVARAMDLKDSLVEAKAEAVQRLEELEEMRSESMFEAEAEFEASLARMAESEMEANARLFNWGPVELGPPTLTEEEFEMEVRRLEEEFEGRSFLVEPNSRVEMVPGTHALIDQSPMARISEYATVDDYGAGDWLNNYQDNPQMYLGDLDSVFPAESDADWEGELRQGDTVSEFFTQEEARDLLFLETKLAQLEEEFQVSLNSPYLSQQNNVDPVDQAIVNEIADEVSRHFAKTLRFPEKLSSTRYRADTTGGDGRIVSVEYDEQNYGAEKDETSEDQDFKTEQDEPAVIDIEEAGQIQDFDQDFNIEITDNTVSEKRPVDMKSFTTENLEAELSQLYNSGRTASKSGLGLHEIFDRLAEIYNRNVMIEPRIEKVVAEMTTSELEAELSRLYNAEVAERFLEVEADRRTAIESRLEAVYNADQTDETDREAQSPGTKQEEEKLNLLTMSVEELETFLSRLYNAKRTGDFSEEVVAGVVTDGGRVVSVADLESRLAFIYNLQADQVQEKV